METKVEHTKGPWFAGTGWIGHGEAKDGRVIARMDHYPYGNSEADITLIAAAPEMLEALDEIIAEADQSNGGKGAQLPIVLHIRGLAAAAIRKATGDV